mmetsp:Transcript_36802/g.72365  ORF Transcript_36802/g.72365 Transcript_36802/m.72365 type:complete len:201 (+) Transcript_36802:165-767(+)
MPRSARVSSGTGPASLIVSPSRYVMSRTARVRRCSTPLSPPPGGPTTARSGTKVMSSRRSLCTGTGTFRTPPPAFARPSRTYWTTSFCSSIGPTWSVSTPLWIFSTNRRRFVKSSTPDPSLSSSDSSTRKLRSSYESSSLIRRNDAGGDARCDRDEKCSHRTDKISVVSIGAGLSSFRRDSSSEADAEEVAGFGELSDMV